MPKVKAKTGRSMRSLIGYVKKEFAIFIGSSTATANVKTFLRETAALCELRKDCKKPVLHFSLSQPPGEPLTNEKWKEVADSFLAKMGLQANSHYIVRHTDTLNDHIHIAVNKIGFDGQLWDTDKSAMRAMSACTEIEMEMGLTVTRTLAEFREETGQRRNDIRDGAVGAFRNKGKVPDKVFLLIQARERKKNEQNRATHPSASRDDGRLDIGQAADQEKNREYGKIIIGNDQQNSHAGKTPGGSPKRATKTDSQKDFQPVEPIKKEPHNEHPNHQPNPFKGKKLTDHRLRVLSKCHLAPGNQQKPSSVLQSDVRTCRRESAELRRPDDQPGQECWIESSGANAKTGYPPSLNGKLSNRSTPDTPAAIDLYWQGRDRPSFRWHSDSGQVQLLARPTEQNVRAVIDLATEQGMKPPMRVFGSRDFQLMIVEQAHKRGIKIEPDDHRARTLLKELENKRTDEIRQADQKAELERLERALKREEIERADNKQNNHQHPTPPRP